MSGSDIKILEEFSRNIDLYIKMIEDDIDIKIFEWVNIEETKKIKKVKQSIENLIKRNKELEEIVKTYNAIPNYYIPNDVKIVIADREYFNNGILKENLIPKSKIKEKIEEIKNRRIEDGECELALYGFQREAKIEILQELLSD